MVDVILGALRMQLMTDQEMRSGVRVEGNLPFKNQLKSAMAKTSSALSKIKPEMIAVPKAISVPRMICVDLDKRIKLTCPKKNL
jgi:hypothetical protein